MGPWDPGLGLGPNLDRGRCIPSKPYLEPGTIHSSRWFPRSYGRPVGCSKIVYMRSRAGCSHETDLNAAALPSVAWLKSMSRARFHSASAGPPCQLPPGAPRIHVGGRPVRAGNNPPVPLSPVWVHMRASPAGHLWTKSGNQRGDAFIVPRVWTTSHCLACPARTGSVVLRFLSDPLGANNSRHRHRRKGF